MTNAKEILQGLYLEATHENGKVYVAAHNAAIDSAIAALGEGDGWMPIDSAPRDGTEIVVFEYAPPSDWCKEHYPKGVPSVDVVCFDEDSWTDFRSSQPDRCPQFWMPLPQPPTEG